MKFKTHNETDVQVVGTHLQGYIYCGYDRLVEVFGEPTGGDGYKVDAEWDIEFEDGKVATIYNYKDGVNYLGEDGEEVETIREWHIGGLTKEVEYRIDKLVRG